MKVFAFGLFLTFLSFANLQAQKPMVALDSVKIISSLENRPAPTWLEAYRKLTDALHKTPSKTEKVFTIAEWVYTYTDVDNDVPLIDGWNQLTWKSKYDLSRTDSLGALCGDRATWMNSLISKLVTDSVFRMDGTGHSFNIVHVDGKDILVDALMNTTFLESADGSTEPLDVKAAYKALASSPQTSVALRVEHAKFGPAENIVSLNKIGLNQLVKMYISSPITVFGANEKNIPTWLFKSKKENELKLLCQPGVYFWAQLPEGSKVVQQELPAKNLPADVRYIYVPVYFETDMDAKPEIRKWAEGLYKDIRKLFF